MSREQPFSVLVVEDEVFIAFMHEQMLVEAGCSVTVAMNGPEALAAARRTSPDLLLLDMNTPGQPVGAGLLTHLRQIRPALPTIVVTGYKLSEAEQAELDLIGGGPPVFVLQKPCDYDVLKARVAAERTRLTH